MSKCKNDILFSKVGMEKLNPTIEVDFTVLTDLPDCRKICQYVVSGG